MRLTPFVTALLVAGAVAAQDPEVKQPRPPMVTPSVKDATSTTEPMIKVAEPQGPVRAASDFPAPMPKTAKVSAAQAISATFADPDLVLINHPGDGRTWVLGHSYKASFGAEGTVFAPLFENAPKHYPVRLGMPQVTVAGRALRSSGIAMADAERTVTFDRGDFQERYQLLGKGIEQQFVFDRLATRGAIVVSVPFTTELSARQNGAGLEFVNELGKVGYSQAVAIDADGNRLALATELRGSSIEITVPTAFVENARLPLVIDPLVGNSGLVAPGFPAPVAERRPDISYDVTNDEYAVVFERFLNFTDTDVFVQRMSGAFAPVGGLVVIDTSFDAWGNAKIASNNVANNHLVVAEVSVDGFSPYWIAGCTMAAGTGATSAQFVIEKDGVAGHAFGDKINPDVGGDPSPNAPTYYTVVWERVFGTDHDIHMKQVMSNGTLRSAAPIRIEDGSADFDSYPTISKSCGTPPSASQYWGIGFERESSPADHDIRGSLVSWDGVILQIGSFNSFSVDRGIAHDTWPSVSSPTDLAGGRRYLLFAYQSQVNGAPPDIAGTVCDVAGTRRSNHENLTVLDGATAAQRALTQNRPSVDSDGCRFIVGFDEAFNSAATDRDVLISLYSFQAGPAFGSLVLNEARQQAGYSPTVETEVEVTSVHSGGGGMTRYAAAWMDADGAANDKIVGIRYDGYRWFNQIGTRATGCGGLNITATNHRLGDTMVLSLPNATGFAGFVFGSPQPGAALPPCPGCLVGVANGATLTANPSNIFLPYQLGALVGAVFAVQGFAFSTGPCLGAIKLSDTLDIGIQ